MSNLLSFMATFGTFMVVAGLAAAWQFRMSKSHIAMRLLLPLVLVALAVATPFQVNKMLGLPIETKEADMPADTQLIFFFPHDGAKLVDLWLLDSRNPKPRAYTVDLTPQLAKLLVAAREFLVQGELVYLKKQAIHHEGGQQDNQYGAQDCFTCGGNYEIQHTEHLPEKP